MARPRRGKHRRNRYDWITDFLITGIPPEDHPDINPFEVISIAYRYEDILPQWEARRDSIMAKWNAPGCRPYAWWRFDAPRLPKGTLRGCHYEGEYPETRLHLGGSGRPVHEVYCYKPIQNFGIWNWYGDPDDPPVFETQWNYLKRLDLLLPGEDEPLPEPHTEPDSIMDAAEWERTRELSRVSRQ